MAIIIVPKTLNQPIIFSVKFQFVPKTLPVARIALAFRTYLLQYLAFSYGKAVMLALLFIVAILFCYSSNALAVKHVCENLRLRKLCAKTERAVNAIPTSQMRFGGGVAVSVACVVICFQCFGAASRLRLPMQETFCPIGYFA